MKYKLLFISLLSGLSIVSYASTGANFKILHTFGTSKIDGGHPYSTIIQANNGALYGSTEVGLLDGAYDESSGGTVYSINTSGVESNYSYIQTNIAQTLATSLIEGNDGSLYGGSLSGGEYNYGSIFKVNADGIANNIISFNNTNGLGAIGNLVKDKDSNIYGTTMNGGKYGQGVVFKLTTDNKFTILHSFTGGINDGSFPNYLTLANDGNLYGTTQFGGLGDSMCYSSNEKGCGTLYSINLENNKYNMLFQFPANDFSSPRSPTSVIGGNDGNLYISTAVGGDSGLGSFVKYNLQNQQFSLLFSFLSRGSGNFPLSITQGHDGNFYGVASNGGGKDVLDGAGTVFEFPKSCMTQSNCPITILHRFTGNDGGSPLGIMQANDGNLYGTTIFGGTANYGVLYEIILK